MLSTLSDNTNGVRKFKCIMHRYGDKLWEESVDGIQIFTYDTFQERDKFHIIKGYYPDLGEVHSINGEKYTFNKKALECIALPRITDATNPFYNTIVGALVLLFAKFNGKTCLIIPKDLSKSRPGLLGGNADSDKEISVDDNGLNVKSVGVREVSEELGYRLTPEGLIVVGRFKGRYIRPIAGINVEQHTLCYAIVIDGDELNLETIPHEFEVSYFKRENHEIVGIHTIPIDLVKPGLQIEGKDISEHHLHFAIHARNKMFGSNIPLNEVNIPDLVVYLV